MGCSSDKESRINVEEVYRTKGLPMPEALEYENNFEKESYMSINLIRNEPKLFIVQIKEVKGNLLLVHQILIFIYTIGHPLYKGKNWANLIKDLEKMEPLPLLKMDQLAH